MPDRPRRWLLRLVWTEPALEPRLDSDRRDPRGPAAVRHVPTCPRSRAQAEADGKEEDESDNDGETEAARTRAAAILVARRVPQLVRRAASLGGGVLVNFLKSILVLSSDELILLIGNSLLIGK